MLLIILALYYLGVPLIQYAVLIKEKKKKSELTVNKNIH